MDVKLNPLFQNEHLKEELIKLKGNIESKEEERESKEEEIIRI